MRFPKTVSLTCSECSTLHTDCPVETDEDGPYAEIETTPCHDDNCTRKLCSCCPQFVCDCCGLTFCLEASHIGHEEEPECTCVQTDVDMVDARGCELHNTRYPVTRYWCRLCCQPETEEVVLEIVARRPEGREDYLPGPAPTGPSPTPSMAGADFPEEAA